VVFYQKSLYSIDCTTSPQHITVGDNQQVEMEAEPWKMMARSALKKEFGGERSDPFFTRAVVLSHLEV
jgi:hypothetical protein